MVEKAKSVAGKPIFILHGDKGGVGKSTYACVLTDWLLKREIPSALIDGDTRNPDVHRMFADSMPAQQTNLRTHEGWMDLTDFMMQHPDRAVVISLPAGIGEEMKREGGRFLQTVKMLERPLVMFWVINRLPDSVNLLNEAMKVMESGLTGKVVVKNLFFGEPEKFSRWESSTTKQRFEQSGGVTVSMSELHERTVDKLFADNDNISPFSQAAVPMKEAHTSPHKLSPSENMELVMWIAENHKTLDGLRGLLTL